MHMPSRGALPAKCSRCVRMIGNLWMTAEPLAR